MPIYSSVLSLSTSTSALYTTLSINRQLFWSGQLSVFLQLQLSLPFAVGAVAVLLLDRIPMLCFDMTLVHTAVANLHRVPVKYFV